MTTDSRSIATGMPTMEPAQIRRNSDGLSFRSARAMSRARFAPKSRCSTTRLRLLRVSLEAIIPATPPCPAAPAFFCASVGFAA